MKLIPSKKDFLDGWDGPFHVSATLLTLVYHLFGTTGVFVLLNIVSIVVFHTTLMTQVSTNVFYTVVLIICILTENIFYLRLIKKGYKQYCKSLLIIAPLAWTFLIYLILN